MAKVIQMPKVANMGTDFTKTLFVPNSAVIVQARMTSQRFPGKSMALLLGEPVIAHVLKRCLSIQGIDKVILASPIGAEQEPMLHYVRNKFPTVKVHLGSQDDVLARYYQVASKEKLDVIMRVTGDCPFIDPRICEKVLQMLMNTGVDYCSNVYPAPTFYKGLDCEAFTYDCLEAAFMVAEAPYDREHVTSWMQRTEGVDRATLRNNKNQHDEKNLCVDYPDDIARLEKEALSDKAV